MVTLLKKKMYSFMNISYVTNFLILPTWDFNKIYLFDYTITFVNSKGDFVLKTRF